MTNLLVFVLRLSLAGSLIALPVLLFRPVIRRKLPQTSATVLWAVVLAVFLIPMDIPSPVSVQKAALSGEPAQAVLTVLTMGTSMDASITASSVNDAAAAASRSPVVGTSSAPAGEPSDEFALRTGDVLTALWLSGTLVLAVSFILRRLALGRHFRDAAALTTADYQRYLGGIRRTVHICTSDTLGTAITYGVLRPKIILPRSLLKADEMTVSHVILHEVQHIRHLDSLQNTLWLCLLCVHWFNPVVWLCRVLARRDRELLCDIGVLRALGPDCRTDYARTILELTPVRGSLGAACSFGSSFGTVSPNMRITRILTYRRPRAGAWCALAVLLGLLLALFAPSTLASYTGSNPSEALAAPPAPEAAAADTPVIPAESEVPSATTVKLSFTSLDDAALREAISDQSPDACCRYILLHRSEGRVYNWDGLRYVYYELLGSTDTPDTILGLDLLTDEPVASSFGFFVGTGSESDSSDINYTFRCTFSGVIFTADSTEYVLLDIATFRTWLPDTTAQEAIDMICENEWG